jgi:hypothetical protein
MADYVTTAQVGGWAQQFSALDSTNQGLLVTAASRLFDNKCEVPENFFAEYDAATPAGFTSRDYYGDGTAYLTIDPNVGLNSVNPVVIDTDPDVNYDLPTYSVIDNQLVVLSETKLQSDTAASFPNRFTGWHQGVKVTVSAMWGWTAVPADVQTAVIALAIHIWRTMDPAFTLLSGVEGVANKTITLPEIAETTIKNYRERYNRNALFA